MTWRRRHRTRPRKRRKRNRGRAGRGERCSKLSSPHWSSGLDDGFSPSVARLPPPPAWRSRRQTPTCGRGRREGRDRIGRASRSRVRPLAVVSWSARGAREMGGCGDDADRAVAVIGAEEHHRGLWRVGRGWTGPRFGRRNSFSPERYDGFFVDGRGEPGLGSGRAIEFGPASSHATVAWRQSLWDPGARCWGSGCGQRVVEGKRWRPDAVGGEGARSGRCRAVNDSRE